MKQKKLMKVKQCQTCKGRGWVPFEVPYDSTRDDFDFENRAMRSIGNAILCAPCPDCFKIPVQITEVRK